MPNIFDGINAMTGTTPVDWPLVVHTYDPKNMLKFQLPPEDDVPAKRVYILWLTVKWPDEDEAYWDYDIQSMVKDIIGGVFESEDRANFARDIYQHRLDYVSSYIQSVKLNELLWKSSSVVE